MCLRRLNKPVENSSVFPMILLVVRVFVFYVLSGGDLQRSDPISPTDKISMKDITLSQDLFNYFHSYLINFAFSVKGGYGQSTV